MEIVLLSGGIDSAVCLAMSHHPRVAVGFDYGQPHLIELEYAKKMADQMSAQFIRSRLPHTTKTDDVIFAGRNALMLCAAVPIAYEHNCDTIVIGSTLSDFKRFPDCRPKFFKALEHAFTEGGYGLRISAPLLQKDKSQVVEMAFDFGIGLDQVWTCYAPKDSSPCGECLACQTLSAAL